MCEIAMAQATAHLEKLLQLARSPPPPPAPPPSVAVRGVLGFLKDAAALELVDAEGNPQAVSLVTTVTTVTIVTTVTTATTVTIVTTVTTRRPSASPTSYSRWRAIATRTSARRYASRTILSPPLRPHHAHTTPTSAPPRAHRSRNPRHGAPSLSHHLYPAGVSELLHAVLHPNPNANPDPNPNEP